MNDSDRIEQLLDTLKAMEDELREQQREADRTTHRAWPHLLLVLLGALSLFNMYFINKLFTESEGMTSSMTQMYIHFGRVASRMSDMRDYVAGMEGNIALMPVITDEMAAMNASIDSMTGNVSDMGGYVGVMDQRVDTMSGAVVDMSQRFRHMNYSVGNIGYQVRQMAKPIP